MSTMAKDEVIAELSRYTGRFPREAVETATAIWSEIADDMVGALEYSAPNHLRRCLTKRTEPQPTERWFQRAWRSAYVKS